MNPLSVPARAAARLIPARLIPARLVKAAPMLLGGAAVALAVSAVPTAASAATQTFFTLSSGPVALTAGGHTWDLSVAFQSGTTTSTPASLDVQLTRSAGTGQREDHTWVFAVPNSTLS